MSTEIEKNVPVSPLQAQKSYNSDKQSPVSEEQRKMLLALRQGCIMQLGAIEEYLGMPRSIVPRHQR